MSGQEQASAVPKVEGHTVRRFDGEMNQIHLKVLEMGGLALAQLKDALRALKNKDAALAQAIAPREDRIDHLEVEADAEVLGLIARRCPMGGDLRMVMAVSKSVTDLERIGDEAMRIASIAQQIYGKDGSEPGGPLLRDVHLMGDFVVEVVEDALRAFDLLDEDLATEVIAQQDRLEDEFEAGLRRLMTYVMEDARNIGFAISVILIIKALERIGAHAANLAEYVIFQVRGMDVRHQGAPAAP
ncbi:phosphate signaling complex protein PhoU [Methylomagnum ishizawai]|uniref:phosphate signaling complex protein PhoU n=1 Tax=Methylomagnum ishizawai TaxID=1760988 RepID=UPI001C32821C|nr:phosphate signaling complex protein PhoU [Methylomagnum ishizawai]BBL76567.1 phosphate transport system regulatory protein PhoU [Methylomagnum ishizawai]